MSVKKDNKTGKWYVRVSYKDEKGKYRQKTKTGFSTKAEAKIYEGTLKQQYQNGGVPVDETFANYFETWCRQYRMGRFSEATDIKYEREIRYVKEYFKHKKLTDITRLDYQSYLNMRGKGNSKDTVQKAHSRLKGALSNALADGIITKDPTFGAIMRYDNEPDKRVKYWNNHQTDILFREFEKELTVSNVMLYLLLSTGLRVGEAYGLSWDDIEGNKLSVRRGYDYNYTNDFTDLKTTSSKRKILLSKECATLLKRYKMQFYKSHPEFLFLDIAEKPAISYSGLSKKLKATCKKNNIPVLTLHSLRHTHCSLMIYKGVDIHYLSKRLGHKDVTITLSTYSHVVDEFQQEQDKKILDAMDSLESAK